MQHEITTDQELLDARGHLRDEGFSRIPHQRYRRQEIRAPWWRIKEWDYYAVIDQDSGVGVTVTCSDLGYIGLFALCFVNLNSGEWRQVESLAVLPRGKTGLAETADEDNRVEYSDSRLSIGIERRDESRTLRFSAAGGSEAEPFSGEITMTQPPEAERMVIATSWAEKRRAFYFNQKINCMPATGTLRIGDAEHRFSQEASFGVLDWGRGNWTYTSQWYWASASGVIDPATAMDPPPDYATEQSRVPFGFNLGYGFSDRTPASENMLFYDGHAHKLEEVTFHFDPEDYLVPWRFTSSDGRLELSFSPVLDRRSLTNLLVIKSDQHQVFGFYSGRAVLDDGREVRLDHFPGFIEDVYNRW